MSKKITKDQVWVVVPAYNEAPYLPRVLPKILAQTKNVIVVDDGSSDETAALAQKNGVTSLRHRLNLGKGAALKTGCDYAFSEMNAKAVIIMDGDDQHDPAEIPLFLTALAEGYQVVFGARSEKKDMPWLRLKVNRLSSFLTYLLFGVYILDIPSGYKAFTAHAYQSLAWNATDYAVELEIVARMAKAHLSHTTVQIRTIYHDLDKGMTALDVLSVTRYLLKLKVTL